MTDPEVVVRLTVYQAYIAVVALNRYRTPEPNAKALAKETNRVLRQAIDLAFHLTENPHFAELGGEGHA